MPVIVITGASAGIGLAIAHRFSRSGWDVALIARHAERLDAAASQLSPHSGRVMTLEADVADSEAVRRAGEAVMTAWGRIDAWVNNAMSTVLGAAEDITDAEYLRVTQTTYLSQVYGVRAALKAMRPVGRGAIVQISSGLALRAAPLQAAYCGAKAAIDGFSDAVRAELQAEGSAITLTTLYLPAVNTPQSTWARNRTGREQIIPDPLFDPRLCADAVWAAVARPTRQIWVGRSTWLMAASQRLAPGLADRQAGRMIDAQLGEAASYREGNLDAPSGGPARIDGPGSDRVVRPVVGWVSSRHVLFLKVVAPVALAALGGVLGFAAGRARR